MVEELLVLNSKHLTSSDIRINKLKLVSIRVIKALVSAGEKVMLKKIGFAPNISGKFDTRC